MQYLRKKLNSKFVSAVRVEKFQGEIRKSVGSSLKNEKDLFCLLLVFSPKHYDSERDDTFNLRTGNGRNGPNFSTQFSFQGEPLEKL